MLIIHRFFTKVVPKTDQNSVFLLIQDLFLYKLNIFNLFFNDLLLCFNFLLLIFYFLPIRRTGALGCTGGGLG